MEVEDTRCDVTEEETLLEEEEITRVEELLIELLLS